MILPIYAYGQPVLKKQADFIDQNYEGLEELINNMWETMYQAHGVGLAAPQIGLPIRLFIIDTTQLMEEGQEEHGLKLVFINASLVEESGEIWTYEEGCLSIPHIRGDVNRPDTIKLRYFDENFQEHITTFTDIHARVIQHEYDHIEGKLFTEKLKPLKKRLIKRKLEAIRTGNVDVDYRMKFV